MFRTGKEGIHISYKMKPTESHEYRTDFFSFRCYIQKNQILNINNVQLYYIHNIINISLNIVNVI